MAESDEQGRDAPHRQPRGQGRSSKGRSYVVPCSTRFRDAVLDLAQRKGVNVGSLARAVILLLPRDTLARWPDPGEPAAGDRESITVKSGPNAGKVWRRKPRLQVRMAAGLTAADIRRVLALALAMEAGELALRLDEGRGPGAEERLRRADSEIARLRKRLRAISFDPLPHAVRSRADALHVLGFPPDAEPDSEAVGRRYRALAAIHHPDSGDGDHARMSQLNAAVRILRKA